jgi:Protein of unknown function (DUF2889).
MVPSDNRELARTAERTATHTRTTTCTSYHRPDGLWDIEIKVEDVKHYDHTMLERGRLSAGTPYHSIGVQLVVDDKLEIKAATGTMDSTPFGECLAATQPLRNLVGATLGRGWRKSVDQALERSHSCTHMREMLYTVASAAIQAIPGYLPQISGKRWPPEFAEGTTAPAFIDGCVSWRQDGEVVLRHYPQFYKRMP